MEKGQKIFQEKFCNCRNSKCMKLYCECFSAGQQCNRNCRCIDCRNQNDNQQAKMLRNISGQNIKILKNQGGKEGKGCSCRKSFCIKKYCECFQEGALCTQNCKCIQCQNNESMANKNVLNNLKRANSNASNKISSLYPIILSQSADHIHNLMPEQGGFNFEEKQIQQGITQVFQQIKSSNTKGVFESFITILRKIDNKFTKVQKDFYFKMESEPHEP